MPTCKCITFLFRNIVTALVIFGYLSVCTSLAANATVELSCPSMPTMKTVSVMGKDCKDKWMSWCIPPRGLWLVVRWQGVLIHSGCCNRNPSTQWLTHNKNEFLTVPETANPRSGCQHFGFWWELSTGLLFLLISSHGRECQRGWESCLRSLLCFSWGIIDI